MSEIILKVNNLSKQYRLGTIGTGTFSHDLNRWWSKVRGKQDPYLKVGETNERSVKATSQYVWALKDINFEVKRGEVLGIIGKNGAGKSTLLKILSQITNPTTGLIKSKGRIASLLEVGTGFHPEMTGKENIFLNGAILGMTKKEIHSKLEEIVEFSGCKQYINTPVKRYSSGMKVRLAFAVAAHLEPDILVVDEVLAVGDAEFQKKAIGKMQDITNSEGRTVLFVSHDMNAIRNLCSSLLVLKNGVIKYVGSTEEGINLYLDNFKKKSLIDFNTLINRKIYDKSILFTDFRLSFRLKNSLFKNVFEIPTGADVFFDVEITANSVPHKNINIALTITDDYNNNYIASISNIYTKEEIVINDFKTIIRFEVLSLNLREGTYFISFWGKDMNGCFDRVEHGFKFKMIESDFYGTGVYPRLKKQGILLLRYKQKIL